MSFDLELARRFDMPLMRGMAVRTPHGSAGHYVGLCDDGRLVLWAENDETSETDADLVLDYTDPGTLGRILAAVRAAWEQPGAFVTDVWSSDPRRTWAMLLRGHGFHGPTEAHALAAAWEGRPR